MAMHVSRSFRATVCSMDNHMGARPVVQSAARGEEIGMGLSGLLGPARGSFSAGMGCTCMWGCVYSGARPFWALWQEIFPQQANSCCCHRGHAGTQGPTAPDDNTNLFLTPPKIRSRSGGGRPPLHAVAPDADRRQAAPAPAPHRQRRGPEPRLYRSSNGAFL
jgi:hypothetical protein